MTAGRIWKINPDEANQLWYMTEYCCSDILDWPTRKDIAEGRAPGWDQFTVDMTVRAPPEHVRALYGGLYSIENGDASWDHNAPLGGR